MNYKIDTKDNIDIIMSLNEEINSKMTEELTLLSKNILNKCQNLIVDFKKTSIIDNIFFEKIILINNQFKKNDLSFVLCNINKDNISKIDNNITITPTLAEAIDMVSMEILERDILKEE